MKRILYVIGSLDVGGAERHLVQMLPILKKQGWDLDVFCTSFEGQQASLLMQQGVGVTAPPLDRLGRAGRWGRFLRLPVVALSFLVHLIRRKPHLIHFFLPESYLLGGFCALLVGGHVRVMSRRSLNDYQTNHPQLAKIEKWLHIHMHHILGNSVAVVRQLVAEGVPTDRVSLIYNGIDLASFSAPRAQSRNQIRQEHQVPADALVFIMVANIIPYKGHADLIEALRLVARELPQPWRVFLVGEDRSGGNLITQTQTAGLSENILWLGSRSDVIDLLFAADIGVLCSHQEGFSNAILEGMATSLPMVVTDVGGNAEAVVNELTGSVVPARDPRRLGAALLEMALNPNRSKMGLEGRRRVEEHFSVLSCAAQYQALYRALLSEPSLN